MYARSPSHILTAGDIRNRIILGLEGRADRFVATGRIMRPNRDLLGTAGVIFTVMHALTSIAAYTLQMLALFLIFHHKSSFLSF